MPVSLCFSRPLLTSLIAVLCLSVTGNAYAKAPSIYMVIAADTISADIRECTQSNTSVFHDSLSDNFPYGVMKTISLYGRDCSAARIKSALDSIPNVSQTPVVFYYSGHGFSTPGKGTHLSFPVGQKSESVETIFQVIERKSPRLFVTIVDCCNVDPPELALGTAPAVPITSISPLAKHLFFQNSGVFHFYSSSEGEAAIGFHSRGDFYMGGSPFTNEFSAQLGRSNRVKSWQDIFEMVRRKTAIGFQSAYPRGLNVTYDGRSVKQMTQTAKMKTHR